MKKPAALNAGLLAVKGEAAPAADVPVRSPSKIVLPKPRKDVPINFKMSDEFVVAFKRRAIDERMKLNELLEKCFSAYLRERER